MDECNIISKYVTIKVTNQVVRKIFQPNTRGFFRVLPCIVGESSVSSATLNLYVKIPNMEQKASARIYLLDFLDFINFKINVFSLK